MVPRLDGGGSLAGTQDVGNAGFAISGAAYIPNGAAPAKTAAARSGGNGLTNRFAGGSASTLGYAYTPNIRSAAPSLVRAAFNQDSAGETGVSQSVRPKPTGATGGPVFASKLVGSDVANTPTAVAHGAVGPASSVIDFGTIQLNSSNTLDLELQNLSADLNGKHGSLTIEGYTITGADASSLQRRILNRRYRHFGRRNLDCAADSRRNRRRRAVFQPDDLYQ